MIIIKEGKNLPDGLHRYKNYLLFSRNNKLIYYFRIKPKPTSDEQRRFEIQDILRRTDELCGNTQGNAFITTQIRHDG